MHATIRTYSDAPGFVDGLVAGTQSIRDLFTTMEGFRGYYCVRTGPDSAVTITLFDDKAGTDASNEAARAWVSEHLPGHAGNAPRLADGDVVIKI